MTTMIVNYRTLQRHPSSQWNHRKCYSLMNLIHNLIPTTRMTACYAMHVVVLAVATTKTKKARTRRADDCRKKKMSYAYYFYHPGKQTRVRVCKDFYFKTLDIDSKRVINAHKTKNVVTGTRRPYIRGKHTKKSCTSQRHSIRRHIESIPLSLIHI